MSINAKGDTFYCDYGTSVVAVRCGSDHSVVERFDLNDSGKFLAENMCKLLNREADALKAQIADRDSRIRLWSARADELRKRCDHWYKLGKPVEDQKCEMLKWLRKISQIRIDQKTGWPRFEELAQCKESCKCCGSCQLCYMLGKGCALEKQEPKTVPRRMTLELSVEKAKARYAQKYGADSWQWRDEGIVFAVGDFLSSCEMTESDWDFAKREGIVAEVNWWLNQQEEVR